MPQKQTHVKTDEAQVRRGARSQKVMRDGRQTGRHSHKQMGRQAGQCTGTQAGRLAHANNEMHRIHIKINNLWMSAVRTGAFQSAKAYWGRCTVRYSQEDLEGTFNQNLCFLKNTEANLLRTLCFYPITTFCLSNNMTIWQYVMTIWQTKWVNTPESVLIQCSTWRIRGIIPTKRKFNSLE